MNDLMDITVTFYYQINDSDFFGGNGSIGYAKASIEHVNNLGKPWADLNKKTAEIADGFNVPVECVKMITWQEYEAEMGKED